MSSLRLQYYRLLKEKHRRKAFSNLMDFIPYVTPNYQKPTHLKPIVDVMHAIANGETKRVLIAAPPQHGKSEIILHGIPFIMNRIPKLNTIYTSYNDTETVARAYKAQEYAKAIGIQANAAFDNKSEFRSVDGGSILAKSLKKGGVGRPADLWIIDDPYSGIDDANSDAWNERVWNFWTGSVKTRMTVNTSIIVMQTRWNRQDLYGKVKETENFEEISIPAIRIENGEEKALWEKQKTLEMLKEEQEGNPHFFLTNYQQEPPESLGEQFKRRGNIEAVESPEFVVYAADLAYTKNVNSDYTVILKFALKEKKIYVTDMVRGRFHIGEIEEIIKETVTESELLLEDNGIQQAINQNISNNTDVWINRRKITGSKLARAMNAIKFWNTGRLKIVEGSWNKEFLKELYSFTGRNDKHDDIVDTLGLGVNYLTEFIT